MAWIKTDTGSIYRDVAKPAGVWTHASDVTPLQWDEIGCRYLEGETATSLAAEYGISASSIRKRFTRR